MPSLGLSKLSTSRRQEDRESKMAAASSQTYHVMGHSRNSSGASIASPPITPTFSIRGHNRWPSSSSSLATSPDSPASLAKPPLQDLLEDPAERDEFSQLPGAETFASEPLCICDTTFCEHRQALVSRSPPRSPLSPEWMPGDDNATGRTFPVAQSVKRQRSLEMPAGKASSRMSRGWPSLSSRWREKRATTSLSNSPVQSAPPSRASSTGRSSLRQSLASHLESRDTNLAPVYQRRSFSSARRVPEQTKSAEAVDFYLPSPNQDPIDREELSSTPLLPPVMTGLQNRKEEELHSPLQSPSVAAQSTTGSVVDLPISAQTHHGIRTPPLSAKPSYASIALARSDHTPNQSMDASRSIMDEVDYWAIKLGHANFHITPEPYFPATCDNESCNRLLEDWESARIEYMRHASHISEHYGLTSRTYKLTEEKWTEIDSEWRSNLDRANSEAEANGQTPALQSLAETQPAPKMTALIDPERPDKFPKIAEGDIVGPMVQYKKVQRTPSKRANFLRIFTDPASLLGGRR